MSAFADISAALDAHMDDLAGNIPVAWDNHSYEPTLGTNYYRATHLPGNTVGATMGLTAGTDEHVGVYQVDVYTEAGAGKSDGVGLADDVANHFRPVTELLYNDRLVRCVTVSRSAGVLVDGWFQIPVTITYNALLIKRQ